MAKQIKPVQDFSPSDPLAVIAANQQHLLEQFQVLAKNQKVLFEELDRMDTRWQNGVYSEPTPVEVANGVDSYPFSVQFEDLCRSVAEIRRASGS